MSFLSRLPDQHKPNSRQRSAPHSRKQKAVRYWPGKAPAPEVQSDDDDDDDFDTTQKERIQEFSSSHPSIPKSAPIADAVVDRRLRRLLLSKQHQEENDLDEEQDNRTQARQPTTSEEAGDKEPDDDDDDVAAIRRQRAREIALARRQKEEEEALAQEQLEAARAEAQGDDSSDYTTGSDDEEDEAPRPLFKPVFLPKNVRVTISQMKADEVDEAELQARREKELEERRKEAHNMVAEDLKKEQAEATATVKNLVTDVDDTDGLDEDAEFEAWKLRELLRIKRDRMEAAARVEEEVEKERRRNMTDTEIIAENAKLNPDQPKSKQRFMQKYFHKGAYYQDDAKEVLESHDFSQPTLEDRFDRTILPEVMQVKNFGRSGRTKWKHLVAEDTTQFDAGWAAQQNKLNKRKLLGSGGHEHERDRDSDNRYRPNKRPNTRSF
ncbi:hypothetical protein SeMB42_g00024 [Synchytrium endobioticum]|uniref:Micro-fibrillar-associated protein 1 C-terminal domain-containing protein n=1 Tax=Synchytrium endobioticum TaxID=286115 RepID=A0A507DAJ5_9FUNG|nr:hypothetical protein SeLEV6574_g02052 [Synchytrium endobioticum]TPX54996.1 hypothetical protein SeMB42_g00024 [Synchytrium endobioticum]